MLADYFLLFCPARIVTKLTLLLAGRTASSTKLFGTRFHGPKCSPIPENQTNKDLTKCVVILSLDLFPGNSLAQSVGPCRLGSIFNQEQCPGVVAAPPGTEIELSRQLQRRLAMLPLEYSSKWPFPSQWALLGAASGHRHATELLFMPLGS